MKHEMNIELVQQAEEWTQDAEQYLDLAVKNLLRTGARLAMVQSEGETAEQMQAVALKADQIKAVVKLVNQAHDGIGIAADFSTLTPSAQSLVPSLTAVAS